MVGNSDSACFILTCKRKKMLEPIQFVSLGPGDPELITLKGMKALQMADVVFCPATVTPAGKVLSRAMDILLELDIDRLKIESFLVPMHKDRSKAVESYKSISQKIADSCKKGLRIAVTAEGDAGFYSSSYYINENLLALNIPTRRIEGIPAFISCGRLSDIHIVKQEEELIVIPGVASAEILKNHIEHERTVVIMKPSQCEAAIKMVMHDVLAHFHYFENVGISQKEFYSDDIHVISEKKFPYFSLLIIRK